MSIIRRILVSVAFLVALPRVLPADSPPNIVVILVDDLGCGDLSSSGATDLQTPNIDRLIADGMGFTNAYANCPVCSPTRAALLTGCFPELVGVPGVIRTHSPMESWGYLTPTSVLLPAMLKKVNYHTACIGKWHLGDEPESVPNAKGFDHFHGFLGDMMDDYYHHRRAGVNFMRLNDAPIEPEGHATDLFTDWAISYIRSRRATVAGDSQPFFLYLAYNAPHTPIQPPATWLTEVKNREPDIADRRAKLVALIEHLDHAIGRVMDEIQHAGIAENTLVIFSSDNGGQLDVGATNGPLRGGKQDMYEGGIRVPQAMVWPGRIPAGSTTNQITLSMDLFPTCCAAAGVTVDHAVDGTNILPVLRGEKQSIERDLFWTRKEGNLRYMGQSVWAIRSGDWKLVQNSIEGPFELYNLAEDPLETTDLRPQHKGRYAELAAKLRAHIQRGGVVPWQPPHRFDPQ
ncbi:MAG: sulfatase-like hydrolase/transferase [Planctomycetota bacterium]|jgi:arylsulfatase A-like enzyme|nr:sulfatase-like hydrolase/transferase [Planctomycetota bacterium]